MEKPLVSVIGFDWDGTLVDSMIVKAQCFAEATLEYYPSLVSHRGDVEELYLRTRGNPRTYQLDCVREKFGLPGLSQEIIAEWSDRFTGLYIEKDLPLFDDTIRTLDALKERGYLLYLSSSVPQDDLDRTLELYPVKGYFEQTLGTQEGGFRKGLPHLSYVSEQLGVPLDEFAFVGDGPDDVKGANEVQVYSVGIADPRIPGSREAMEENNPDLLVENLTALLEHFEML